MPKHSTSRRAEAPPAAVPSNRSSPPSPARADITTAEPWLKVIEHAIKPGNHLPATAGVAPLAVLALAQALDDVLAKKRQSLPKLGDQPENHACTTIKAILSKDGIHPLYDKLSGIFSHSADDVLQALKDIAEGETFAYLERLPPLSKFQAAEPASDAFLAFANRLKSVELSSALYGEDFSAKRQALELSYGKVFESLTPNDAGAESIRQEALKRHIDSKSQDFSEALARTNVVSHRLLGLSEILAPTDERSKDTVALVLARDAYTSLGRELNIIWCERGNQIANSLKAEAAKEGFDAAKFIEGQLLPFTELCAAGASILRYSRKIIAQGELKVFGEDDKLQSTLFYGPLFLGLKHLGEGVPSLEQAHVRKVALQNSCSAAARGDNLALARNAFVIATALPNVLPLDTIRKAPWLKLADDISPTVRIIRGLDAGFWDQEVAQRELKKHKLPASVNTLEELWKRETAELSKRLKDYSGSGSEVASAIGPLSGELKPETLEFVRRISSTLPRDEASSGRQVYDGLEARINRVLYDVVKKQFVVVAALSMEEAELSAETGDWRKHGNASHGKAAIFRFSYEGSDLNLRPGPPRDVDTKGAAAGLLNIEKFVDTGIIVPVKLDVTRYQVDPAKKSRLDRRTTAEIDAQKAAEENSHSAALREYKENGLLAVRDDCEKWLQKWQGRAS